VRSGGFAKTASRCRFPLVAGPSSLRSSQPGERSRAPYATKGEADPTDRASSPSIPDRFVAIFIPTAFTMRHRRDAFVRLFSSSISLSVVFAESESKEANWKRRKRIERILTAFRFPTARLKGQNYTNRVTISTLPVHPTRWIN